MGKRRKQFLTHDDAVPADSQHEQPCSDCPWARTALKGWLGAMSADEWLKVAHVGEAMVDCHAFLDTQCAGIAIYRANVAKRMRDERILELPADSEAVFRTPTEFKEHHGS